MAERVASPVVILTRKSLFCFFTFTSLLFVLSWIFVLRSTSRPNFIDNTLLPNSRLLSGIDHAISATTLQNDNEPYSAGARSIVADKEDDEEFDKSASSSQCRNVTCDTNERQVLKVYMYDLPTEFHFGLLDWKPQVGGPVWPDLRSNVLRYPGGLNLQHSIEYWLTLDLLASELPNPPNARFAIRVHNVSEADIIFVPFFSSLCYNRFSKKDPHQRKTNNKILQDKLVQYLTSQKEWKASGGRDHLIVAHHPNSLLDARTKLWPATFILSDFGRYSPNVANVEKDVIAPYMHVIKTFENDSSTFESRPTLLYFQGAIYRKDGGIARQELYYLLKGEKDVHFTFGTVQKNGVRDATQGMHSSKFCLNIAGDTPSSNRLFDAIASHCVPVIISDNIELPYEDVLDYSEFCIFVRTRDAVKKGYLVNLIRSISKEEWTRMWKRLHEVEKFYEFHYPSSEDDAVQMIWKAVARRVPGIRLKLNRSRRFSRLPVQNEKGLLKGLTRIAVPKNFW